MPMYSGDEQNDANDANDEDKLTAGAVELGGSQGFLPVIHERPPALCDFGCVHYHEVKVLVEQMAPVDGSEADARYATIRTCYPAAGIDFPLDEVVTQCNLFEVPAHEFKTTSTTKAVDAYQAAFGMWMKSAAEKEAELQKEMEDLLDVSDAPIDEFCTIRVFAPDGQTIIGEVSTTSEPTPDHVRELVPALERYAARDVSVQVRDHVGRFLSAFSFTV